MDYSKQVPAAERALNVLEALAAEPEGLTSGELLQQLGLPRSALFALLNTLKARHYVEQMDNRGRYRLGPALWALTPGRQDELGELVRAFIDDEALRRPAESLSLLWLDGDEVVTLAQREGRQQVRAVLRPGERRSVAQSAAGMVLLAGAGPAHESLAPGKERPTLIAEALLAKVRHEGFAQNEEVDVLELACPICADGVHPIAALQAALPRFRNNETYQDSVLYETRRAAARLSFRLGAAVYQPYGWSQGEPLGPNSSLSDHELSHFLQGAWSARLACVRADGTPHVLPLWYEWDGTHIWLAASPGAHWKQLVRDSQQVSLTIDEPWPPLRRAFIEGRAETVAPEDALGGLQGLRRRLAVRYLGRGAGERAELTETEGWDVVRVTPQRISGQQGLGRA